MPGHVQSRSLRFRDRPTLDRSIGVLTAKIQIMNKGIQILVVSSLQEYAIKTRPCGDEYAIKTEIFLIGSIVVNQVLKLAFGASSVFAS